MDIELLQNPGTDSSKSIPSRKRKRGSKIKPAEKKELQIMDNMDEILEDAVEIGNCIPVKSIPSGKMKRREKKKAAEKKELQNVDNMDEILEDYVEIGNCVSVKSISSRKMKRKAKKKAAETKELQIMDNMDEILEDYVEIGNCVSVKSISSRKIKRRAKKKAAEEKELQIMDNMDENLEDSVQIGNCISVDSVLEKNLLDMGLDRQKLACCPKTAAGSEDNLSGLNTKKLKKRLKINKTKTKFKLQSTDQVKMDTESIKMDVESTKECVEGNVKRKRKKRLKITKKAENTDAIQIRDPSSDMLNLHLSDGDHGRENDSKLTEKKITAQESEISLRKESSSSYLVKYMAGSSDFCSKDDTVLLLDRASCGRVTSDFHEERSDDLLMPMKAEEKLVDCDQMAGENSKVRNGINERDNEIVCDGKCLPEGRIVSSVCDVDLTHVSCPDIKEVKDCLQISSIPCAKRKLLVLDVNGLLADIVFPGPKLCKGDTNINGRAVFKRPFCDDFLKFCFQHFDVGIWSSRSKRIIDRVVDYLLGNLQKQLKFCWDMSRCTQTGFKTLENCHKPLVCKELRRIWENNGPNFRWRKGYYNESNTLLLDDSPYKALLNPLHSTIFPNSYHHEDKNDNALGPGGDLRVYLEGLLTSDNVQKYVEQHPIGQSAINESSSSWEFYSGVLEAVHGR